MTKPTPTPAPFLLAFTLALLAPLAARADVIPPWEQDCERAQTGDACRSGPGTCLKAKCSRNDYPRWDRDASPNGPPQRYFDCLTCFADAGSPVPATDDAGDAAPATGSDAGDAAPSPHATGDAAPARPSDADAAPSSPPTDVGPVVPPRAAEAVPTPTTATGTVSSSEAPSSEGASSDDGGGCSLAYGRLAHDLGPWLLAGGFALLVSRRKRGR